MEEHQRPHVCIVVQPGCIQCSHDGEHHELHPGAEHQIPAHPWWLHLFDQPVDIGVNKPIKNAMTIQYKDWLTEGGGLTAGVAKAPTRNLLAECYLVLFFPPGGFYIFVCLDILSLHSWGQVA